ncbi:MAG: exosortase K [Lachnospiraceae bacterium]|jgi:exosortase K|nr:exosortase K [Lachnospiraceae bacterium]
MRDKKSIRIYFLGLLMVLGLKLYADQAGSDELLWILRPTAWWTGILSGHSFTYEQGAGYVNHSLRFIIAPACAGLKFWMIAALMLSWSFLHRMKGGKGKLYWTLFSFLAAGLVTIFVNGIRITLSIVLPQLLESTEHIMAHMSSGQLHTAIGTFVYFLSLLALYWAGNQFSQKIGLAETVQKEKFLWAKLLPILWYLGPVLGLPFLSRIAYKDYKNFTDYELPVLAVCGSVFLFLILLLLGKKFLWQLKTAK